MCPADALPVLAVVTGVFHLVWLLFFLFGSYNLENTGLQYECDQQGLLRAANYGLLATFFVSAIVSFTIMGVGLRGEHECKCCTRQYCCVSLASDCQIECP